MVNRDRLRFFKIRAPGNSACLRNPCRMGAISANWTPRSTTQSPRAVVICAQPLVRSSSRTAFWNSKSRNCRRRSHTPSRAAGFRPMRGSDTAWRGEFSDGRGANPHHDAQWRNGASAKVLTLQSDQEVKDEHEKDAYKA